MKIILPVKVIIPDSVRDYCARKGIRTAIDTLSEKGDDYLPDHLEWDELRSFHKSILAAATVKTDFALLCLDLWDGVWKPALASCDIDEAYNIDDLDEDEQPSLKKIWGDESLCRAHHDPRDENGSLYTSIWVAPYQKQPVVHLGVGLWDGEGNPLVTESNVLGDTWEIDSIDEPEGWFWTTKKAFAAIEPASTAEIDVTPMRQAAEEALRSLMACKSPSPHR